MDNLENMLKDILSQDIKPPKRYFDKIDSSINSLKSTTNILHQKSIKHFLIAACFALCLITGTVFAKEIGNFFKERFGLGEGVQTAVDNGYVGYSEDNVNYFETQVTVTKGDSEDVLDTFNTGFKISNFVITDNAISLEIELKFDKKINNYKNLGDKINGNINYENFGNIELGNFFILDEENNLIVSSLLEDEFNIFCKEHNLNYTYLEFNENYCNSVANCNITEIDDELNIVKMDYIIDSSTDIPKSKELYLYFDQIIFIPKEDINNESNYVILNGNWNITLDVPEKIYNREDIFYKVVSSENKDFDVYTAKATDIGFEVGITISNVEPPKAAPEELIDPRTGLDYIFNSREELLAVNQSQDFENKYIEYMNSLTPIRLNGYPGVNWLEYTDGCYILDENGNKFYATKNNSKKQNANFNYVETFDEQGFSHITYLNEFDFYNEFSITKYNLTDTLYLVLDFYGSPVKIKLQKDS